MTRANNFVFIVITQDEASTLLKADYANYGDKYCRL